MPISTSSQVVSTLTVLTVSMTDGAMHCHFDRTLDGKLIDGVDIHIEGVEMLLLLSQVSYAGSTIGNMVTDAVYQYAVDRKLIMGAIS